MIAVALILLALATLIGYLIVRDFTRAFSQAQRVADGACDCSRHRVCASCLERAAGLRREEAA